MIMPYGNWGMTPQALAYIQGSERYPDVRGAVYFYEAPGGTWVSAQVMGLPPEQTGEDGAAIGPFFSFHLHTGNACTPAGGSDPFSDAMGHYNPTNAPHPRHAGDFPVLLSNNGYAEMGFFTNRFKPWDAVGRTVIIHLLPDDYRSQPAGAAGERIGCGLVQPLM
jgi:Cu-Zn family superoxide dismutase